MTTLEVIGSARGLRIKAPAGATMLRVIGDGHKVSMVSIASATFGENVFRGVVVELAEVGTIGKGGKFQAMDCVFEARDAYKQSPATHASRALVNNNQDAGEQQMKNKKTDKTPKSKPLPRGGLAADAIRANGKGKGEPKAPKEPKLAAARADGEPKKNRKARIRELYVATPPLRKSQIVDMVIAEGFTPESDRAKVVSAVNNESSYMKLDGLSPKWEPEIKAAKPEAK